MQLKTGNVLKVSIEDKYKESGDENTIYVDYMNIVKVLVPGDIIFVDDGLLSLKVTEKTPTHLTTGMHWYSKFPHLCLCKARDLKTTVDTNLLFY